MKYCSNRIYFNIAKQTRIKLCLRCTITNHLNLKRKSLFEKVDMKFVNKLSIKLVL